MGLRPIRYDNIAPITAEQRDRLVQLGVFCNRSPNDLFEMIITHRRQALAALLNKVQSAHGRRIRLEARMEELDTVLATYLALMSGPVETGDAA